MTIEKKKLRNKDLAWVLFTVSCLFFMLAAMMMSFVPVIPALFALVGAIIIGINESDHSDSTYY